MNKISLYSSVSVADDGSSHTMKLLNNTARKLIKDIGFNKQVLVAAHPNINAMAIETLYEDPVKQLIDEWREEGLQHLRETSNKSIKDLIQRRLDWNEIQGRDLVMSAYVYDKDFIKTGWSIADEIAYLSKQPVESFYTTRIGIFKAYTTSELFQLQDKHFEPVLDEELGKQETLSRMYNYSDFILRSMLNEKYNNYFKELIKNDNLNKNELFRKLYKHSTSHSHLQHFQHLIRVDDGVEELKELSNIDDDLISNYYTLLKSQRDEKLAGEFKRELRKSHLNPLNDKEISVLLKEYNDKLYIRFLSIKTKQGDSVEDIFELGIYNEVTDAIVIDQLTKTSNHEYKFRLGEHAVKHSNNLDVHLDFLDLLLKHPPISVSEVLYKTYTIITKTHQTPKSGHYNVKVVKFQDSMLNIWNYYNKPTSLIPVITDLLISCQQYTFLSQSNFRSLFYLNKDIPFTQDLAIRSFDIYYHLVHKSRETDAKNVNIQLRSLHGDETIDPSSIMDLDTDGVFYQTIYDAIPVILKQFKFDLAKEVVKLVDSKEGDLFYAKKCYLEGLLLAYEAENQWESNNRESLFGESLERIHKSLSLDPKNTTTLKLYSWVSDQVYNTDTAISALREALTIDSSDWEAWLRLANLLSAKDTKGALDVVQSALDLSEGTSSRNDPLAPETVSSIERAHLIMKLLILENLLVEETIGVDEALSNQTKLFGYYSNNIPKSTKMTKLMEEFSFYHPSERRVGKRTSDDDSAFNYPLKLSSSEGALAKRRHGLESSSSMVSQQSTNSSKQSSRRSRLHVPVPHISVGSALGKFRSKKHPRSVNGTAPSIQTAPNSDLDLNKNLPRIRVSSVPNEKAKQNATNGTVDQNKLTISSSASNVGVDVQDYEHRELNLLTELWLMSAASYRRSGDLEQAANALNMAEECGPTYCGVYVELAKQCVEQKELKSANEALIKAQFLAASSASESERSYQIAEYEYASSLFNLSDNVNEVHPNLDSNRRLDAVEGLLEILLRSSHFIHRNYPGAHYMLAMCYKSRNRLGKVKGSLESALKVERTVGVLSLDGLEF
ncbi:hypothetical protein E3Q00_04324 [Wallemia mellicola]|nr:hypothetical protein E3Q00_04324 [Wallemia mellicola]